MRKIVCYIILLTVLVYSETLEYKSIKLNWEKIGEHGDFGGYQITSQEIPQDFEVLMLFNKEYSVLKYKDEFVSLDLNFIYDSDVNDAIESTKSFMNPKSDTLYILTEMATEELPNLKLIAFKNNKFEVIGYFSFPSFDSLTFKEKYKLWNKYAKWSLKLSEREGVPLLYFEHSSNVTIELRKYDANNFFYRYFDRDIIKAYLKKYLYFKVTNRPKNSKRRTFFSSVITEKNESLSFRLLSGVEYIGSGVSRAFFRYKYKQIEEGKVTKRLNYESYVYAHCGFKKVERSLYIGDYEKNKWFDGAGKFYKEDRLFFKDENRWQEIVSADAYAEIGNLLCGIPEFVHYGKEMHYLLENKPLVQKGFGRSYRTRLKQALKEKKPEFEGQYIIAQWGCDEGKNGCTTGGIIDASTGKAIPFPFKQYEVNEAKEIIYRLNSSLIIFAGDFEFEDGSKTFNEVRFYEMKDGELLFLKAVPYKEKRELSYMNEVGSLGQGLIKINKENFKLYRSKSKSLLVNIAHLKLFMTPIFYKPDYGVCYFVLDKEEEDYYVVNSANGKKFKIKKEKDINSLSWKKFITQEATGISEFNTIGYMYDTPNTESKKSKIKDFDSSEILDMQGDWLKIKNQNRSGWIEWRDETKLLFVFSLLC